MKNSAPHKVLFVVFPQIKLLDLAGPLQVFADAVDDNGIAVYRTEVVSIDGQYVKTDTPVSIATEAMKSWANEQIDTLIVVGGNGARAAALNPHVVDGVLRLAEKADRIASVCTGAFVLAACGLLDGRRAVTHWQSCDALSREHPCVLVETDPIYVKAENVWTSAGVTAGIDMALAMVAEDIGRTASLSLARELVSYVVRPGGQSQFSSTLDRQILDETGRFESLHEWIANNIDKDLRVDVLAERANMSPRNFARLYTQQTGRTPAKAVEGIRMEAARRSLEESDLSVSEVARQCGFGDDERMRRSFIRLLHVSPSDYRQRFATGHMTASGDLLGTQ
ncbi:GlxA family transcriptional regulator [Roseibium marinum]|uniref:Transcriptional regulator GlxA family with amidase domain n=1 Tax=Roseibium marinum TaxID=281252 RepID=A0A2S3UTN2_9HYPH|nr:DJ-1/PfpI family protein [Roseibium marinum]POF31014.1 transcriptional regulator GlxA family with amidase domain [Roseibium marinum]